MKILLIASALMISGCTVIMAPDDEQPVEECHYTCPYSYCYSDEYVYECTYYYTR